MGREGVGDSGDATYIRSPNSELPGSMSAKILFTITLELTSLSRCSQFLVSERS